MDEARTVVGGGGEGAEGVGVGAWIPAETGEGARPPEETQMTGGGARPPKEAGYMPGWERTEEELTGHFFAGWAALEAHWRHLPHWGQDGTLCFVTFRLADSLPSEKLAEWKAERAVWLKRHPEPWGEEERREYLARFPNRLERWLDAGHGECLLRGVAARRCMDGVFARSDGGRCRLHAYVVMPNHVHVLFKLRDRKELPGLLQEWKGVSAHLLNRELGRKGRVWQEEYHDRLVRNFAHYRRALEYIRKNWESWRGGRGEGGGNLGGRDGRGHLAPDYDGRGRLSPQGCPEGLGGRAPRPSQMESGKEAASGRQDEEHDGCGAGRPKMTGGGEKMTGEGARPPRVMGC